jgi:hypothetical protein
MVSLLPRLGSEAVSRKLVGDFSMGADGIAWGLVKSILDRSRRCSAGSLPAMHCGDHRHRLTAAPVNEVKERNTRKENA